MSEKQQTAVDYLLEYCERENWSIPNDIVEIVKEMEREQIKSAYVAGREDWHLDKYFSKHSEDYYNQTYNH